MIVLKNNCVNKNMLSALNCSWPAVGTTYMLAIFYYDCIVGILYLAL